MINPKSFHSIQFLRFLAAALVVISHADYISAISWPDSSPDKVSQIMQIGRCGVHIFFVISGFVMVYSTFSPAQVMTPASFLSRRFFRIFPIYWAYAALYLIGFYVRAIAMAALPILGSLALLPGYSSLIIGQGWSLSYEIYFYICFASIMLLGKMRGLVTLTIFFLASIASRRFLPTSNAFVDLISNSLLIEFIAGSWLAWLVLSGFRISAKTANATILLGAVCFAAGAFFDYEHVPTLILWGAPSILVVAGAVFLEVATPLPKAIIKLSFLGDSSYSLYLLHAAMLSTMLICLGPIYHPDPATRVFICLFLSAVCCLASIAAYASMERPLVDRLRRGLAAWARQIPPVITIR